MISVRPIQNGVIGLVLLAVAPFLFAAESGSRSPVEVETLPSGSQSTSGQQQQDIEFRPPIEEESGDGEYAGFETQHRLQMLQQEVQALRGMVEELRYQLQRMQSTQEERYLELDSRFQGLQEQVNQSGGASAGTAPSGTTAEVPDESEIVVGDGDEQERYNTALELIRNRQYASAVEQLEALIDEFPEGKLTANAYYWLGEVHAAKQEPDYESARQALAQVITFFPDSRKVPDAAFKLGKVYHLMGNCERAEELLTQVMEDHVGKSVAQLAETYLRDQVDCDN